MVWIFRTLVVSIIFLGANSFSNAQSLLWSIKFFCDDGINFEVSKVETGDLVSTRTKDGRALSLKIERGSNGTGIFDSELGSIRGTIQRINKSSAYIWANFKQNNENKSVLSPNFGQMTATLSGRGTVDSQQRIDPSCGETSDEDEGEFAKNECVVTGSVKQVINYVSNKREREVEKEYHPKKIMLPNRASQTFGV